MLGKKSGLTFEGAFDFFFFFLEKISVETFGKFARVDTGKIGKRLGEKISGGNNSRILFWKIFIAILVKHRPQIM